MLYHNESQVRAALDRQRGKKVSDGVWRLLVRDRYVSEVQKGVLEMGKLEERAAELETLEKDPQRPMAKPKTRRQKRLKGRDLRAEALAVLLAAKARNRSDVKAFRDQVLGGQLLSFADAAQWIRREYEEHKGKHGQTVRIKAPDGTKFSQLKGKWLISPPLESVASGDLGLLSDFVVFVVEQEERVIPLPACSPHLEWLQKLARRLSTDYWWAEARATMFILTDLRPPASSASVGRILSSEAPSLVRIRLEVDLSYSPREVAELYASQRLAILGRRPKLMKDKQVKLAMFMAEFAGTNEEAMAQWNRLFRQHTYRRLGSFNRDAKRARDLLVNSLMVDPKKLEPLQRAALELAQARQAIEA